MYEPTPESVKKHWEAMGKGLDDGRCISLCGRRRVSMSVFCQKCSKEISRVRSERTVAYNWASTTAWIAARRGSYVSATLWPQWV